MSYWRILDCRHLERPTDWDAVFGRKAPLILEIGFGRADHLIHLGKKHPEANVIGIEISQPSLRKASSKVKNNQLENVRVLDGSGSTLLWTNIKPQSLSQLHVNFPDPWHKEGHQKRRLINPDFLHLAATRLQPNGLLFVATDHPSYQPVVTDCLEQTTYFDSRLATTYTLDPGDRFQTKYELKALREGRTPFYYLFQRNDTVAPNTFAIPEELPMPHAIIQSPITLTDVQAAFTPFHLNQQALGLHIHFKDAFLQVDRPTLLIETYIRQQPQDQRLGIIITERGEQEFIVKLHDFGFPRVTDGVHVAVGRMADWLAGLHPEGKVATHTLQVFDSAETV